MPCLSRLSADWTATSIDHLRRKRFCRQTDGDGSVVETPTRALWAPRRALRSAVTPV